jgi:hypothetical protein
MSFLWNRGADWLWRQGIDLIGDDRGSDVGESIEDGTMFRESESLFDYSLQSICRA